MTVGMARRRLLARILIPRDEGHHFRDNVINSIFIYVHVKGPRTCKNPLEPLHRTKTTIKSHFDSFGLDNERVVNSPQIYVHHRDTYVDFLGHHTSEFPWYDCTAL